MADELLDTCDGVKADSEEIQRAAERLCSWQIDTRKWLLSKALPKIYGDKLEVETKGKVVHAAETIVAARRRASAARRRAASA